MPKSGRQNVPKRDGSATDQLEWLKSRDKAAVMSLLATQCARFLTRLKHTYLRALVYGKMALSPSRRTRVRNFTSLSIFSLFVVVTKVTSTELFQLLSHSSLWKECHSCCQNVKLALEELRTFPGNLACFDLTFTHVYTFTHLTRFDQAHTFYLNMAKVFLADVGSRVKSRGMIIWRLQDDASLDTKLAHRLHSIEGLVIVGHSVIPEVASHVTFVPNFHYISTKGFEKLSARLTRQSVQLTSRMKKVFWRGSTTGVPCLLNKTCENTCDGVHRVRFVRAAKDIPWFDVRLSQTVQLCNGDQERLLAQDLMSNFVDEREWVKYAGVIDIDGNVDAWGFHWRLKSGSVVFKVRTSFVNMYSASLIPGVHFVEVSEDFAGLEESTKHILMTTESAISRYEEMIKRASLVMEQFTYDKVRSQVISDLENAWSLFQTSRVSNF